MQQTRPEIFGLEACRATQEAFCFLHFSSAAGAQFLWTNGLYRLIPLLLEDAEISVASQAERAIQKVFATKRPFPPRLCGDL